MQNLWSSIEIEPDFEFRNDRKRIKKEGRKKIEQLHILGEREKRYSHAKSFYTGAAI